MILSLERWGIIAHAGVGDIGEVRSLCNSAGFGVNRDQIVGIGKTGNDLSIYNETGRHRIKAADVSDPVRLAGRRIE